MQTHKERARTEQAEQVDGPAPQASAEFKENAEKLKSELDALLDDIDDVLESNAQAFVKSFVQGNGE